MRKLAYILFMILLIAANAAVGQDTIDVVCQGADRFYRVDGVENSDWVWTLENEAGDTITTPVFAWEDFTDTDSVGNPVYGSEIEILWDVEPGTYSLSVEQTSNYISVEDSTSYIHCVNHELGKVIVVPGPEALAGDDMIACSSDNVYLGDASVTNSDSLLWETFGTGTFSVKTDLHPTYFPSEEDIASGSVTLSLIAFGQAGAEGCAPFPDMITITFGQPEIALSADIPLCYGENSGTVSASVSGGFGDYTFAWTGPDNFTANTAEISNLVSGMYYLSVTDSLGCMAEDSIEVTQPEELIAVIDSVVHVDCYGNMNGAARIMATGGTGSYTWSWNTDPPQTDSLATGLAAGEYIVTVTDENGCEAKDTVIITEPPPLVLTADSIDARCGGRFLGSIDLTVSGGTPFADGSYLYEWHDNTGVIATTEDIFDLEGDKLYWVYVTDSLGCIDSLDIYINEEKNVRIELEAITQILCYGDSSGSIEISVRPGNRNFTYEWYHNGVLIDTENQDLVNIPSGRYRVVVNDKDGCDDEMSFTLEDPEELLAEISPDPAEVCEGASLPLNGNPTGGTGGFIHFWTGDGAGYLNDTAIVNPEFSGAMTGTYRLIYNVTDSVGCFASDTIDIQVLPHADKLEELTVCENELPYTWYGHIFSGDSTLIDTVASVTEGCDTVRTLVLNTEPLLTDFEELTVCENELPYTWYGHVFSGDSTLVDTVASVTEGCDTVRTLVLNTEPLLTGLTRGTVMYSMATVLWLIRLPLLLQVAIPFALWY